MLSPVYNVIICTCESCVSEGVQLPLRKAVTTDLEPSAIVVGGPGGAARSEARPTAVAGLGVASQARRRPIMKRSRDADLLRGISLQSAGRDNVLLANSG